MTTRRTFIKKGGLTAGGLAAATVLGATVFPAGAAGSEWPGAAGLPSTAINFAGNGAAGGIKISKMFMTHSPSRWSPFR
jgi:hypothetical protein